MQSLRFELNTMVPKSLVVYHDKSYQAHGLGQMAGTAGKRDKCAKTT